MPARHLPLVVSAALLVATFGLISAAEPARAALTDAQRKELAAILAEFRRVRPQPEKRVEVIERAGKIGPIAVNNLLAIVNKELSNQLGNYRQQFMQAAAQSAAARTAEVNLQEISEIRSRVLALAKDDNLTEKQIKEVGDPGLAKLKELIIFNREDVLKQHPALQKPRDQLQTLGKQWEKCATLLMLAEDDAKDDATPDPAAEKKSCADEGDESIELKLPSFDEYLLKEEEIAAALAMPMDPQTRQILAANAQLSARIDPEEARCVLDLNLLRNLLGLSALQLDLALTAAARDHSLDMQEQKFFAHESPVAGKKEPWDRAGLSGPTASSENIAMGTIDGAVVNEMWWHSPGHHRNLVGDHIRVGVGRTGKHWTELFGR